MLEAGNVMRTVPAVPNARSRRSVWCQWCAAGPAGGPGSLGPPAQAIRDPSESEPSVGAGTDTSRSRLAEGRSDPRSSTSISRTAPASAWVGAVRSDFRGRPPLPSAARTSRSVSGW
jgi:hypothetical protein